LLPARRRSTAGRDVRACASGRASRRRERRFLPFDVAVARVAGRLSDRARSKGRSPGFPDLAIAATAAAHNLTVLTRNLRHFAPLGVPAHDPFAALPQG
jgi:predicted nucleic acid-binding protein